MISKKKTLGTENGVIFPTALVPVGVISHYYFHRERGNSSINVLSLIHVNMMLELVDLWSVSQTARKIIKIISIICSQEYQ